MTPPPNRNWGQRGEQFERVQSAVKPGHVVCRAEQRITPSSRVETTLPGVRNSLWLLLPHHIRHASVWTTRRFGLFGFGFWSTPNVLPTHNRTSFAAGLISSHSNAMALWMPIPYGRRMTVSTPRI